MRDRGLLERRPGKVKATCPHATSKYQAHHLTPAAALPQQATLGFAQWLVFCHRSDVQQILWHPPLFFKWFIVITSGKVSMSNISFISSGTVITSPCTMLSGHNPAGNQHLAELLIVLLSGKNLSQKRFLRLAHLASLRFLPFWYTSVWGNDLRFW